MQGQSQAEQLMLPYTICLFRHPLSFRVRSTGLMTPLVVSLVHTLSIFVAHTFPLDLRGNRTLIIICCVNLFVLYPGTRYYYKWKNAQRDKMWDAMTTEVCIALLQETYSLYLTEIFGLVIGKITLSCDDQRGR